MSVPLSYLRQYERYLKYRHYSPQTVRHYVSDLELFKSWTDKSWGKITKADVSAFIEKQLKQGLSPKSINRRLYVMKGFYEYLQEDLQYNVRMPVRSSHFIRRGRPLPKTLNDNEVTQLFRVITDPRDRAIFALMLRCGLRVGEVADLEFEHVNLFGRQIRFTGKGRKERVVPLSDEMVSLLKQCLRIRPKRAPKFFWNKKQPKQPLRINSIQRLLKRYGEQAGVEIHCHLLRHTFARQMTENGVERTALRDLMGHANISSTDGYGKLSDPYVKQSYFETMERIMAQNPVDYSDQGDK
jgi:site-specific recombinase XerD